MVAATGILNVWSNDPGETAAADADLRAGFPGRFMLGVGIGHPEATSDYRRPLRTMRAFLDGLDASPTPPPAHERCLAALGPKMLISPASGPPAPIRTSRPSTARSSPASDSVQASSWLPSWRAWSTDRGAPKPSPATTQALPGLRNYTKNLLDLGFTERDLATAARTG